MIYSGYDNPDVCDCCGRSLKKKRLRRNYLSWIKALAWLFTGMAFTLGEIIIVMILSEEWVM